MLNTLNSTTCKYCQSENVIKVLMTEEWVGRQGNRFYETVRKVDEVHQKQRAEGRN